MPNPWDNDPIVSQATSGPVYGAAKPVDPYRAEDQNFQRGNAARAEEDQRRQAEKDARDRLEWNATHNPDGSKKPDNGDPKLVESERTAAFLATRVAGGMQDIGRALSANPGAAKPGVGATVASIFGDEARNWANSPARQQIEAAQLDVLDAALTLGTGAAYSPAQLKGYQRSYFPTLTDDAATVADKKLRLSRLLEAAELKAGGAAPQIDEALAAINGAAPDERVTVSDPRAQLTDPGEPAPLEVEVVGGGVGTPLVLPRKSIPAQLGESTANVAAGIGQGLAAIPDMAANAAGAVMAVPADLLGFDQTAEAWRNPTTIGGLIEKAIPTPSDGVGKGVRLISQLGGSVAGFPQRTANALAESFAGRVPPGFTGGGPARGLTAEGRDVIDAGGRQGVPIRQPDARPAVRGDFAAVAQSRTGGPVVGNALAADRATVAQRVSEVADGQARDPYALGTQVQGAMTRHAKRTKDEATALFARVDRAAPGHVADPAPVISAIDQKIAGLIKEGATANAAEIKVLDGIKADFGESGISVKSLQTQRRALRQRLKDNGIDFGSADASYMSILNDAGKALESSLKENPKALGALKTANAKWAERAAFRNDVAKQFSGTKGAPLKPETAAQRFISMAKRGGDYNRFSRGIQELEPSERGDLGATIAEGMGRIKSGEFSYGQFVKDFEGMNPRAIRDLYGAKGEQALRDLRDIAKAKSGTAGAMNHSNTGGVVARSNGFRDLVLTAFGGGVAGVPGAIVGAVSRSTLEKFSSARQARMLLDPTFTKWLKQMPNSTNPKVIDQHFARLTTLAANSPTLAGDAKALQAFLTDALQQSPGRLAAAQDETNGRRVPPQR